MFQKKKKLSAEALCVVLLTVVWDLLVYFGTKLISASWYHHDMTMPADHAVPFLPWTVVIYFGSYAMWFAGYYLFAHQEAKLRNRFFLADTMAKFVCLACFLLLPTTNVRPEVSGDGPWIFLMRLLYLLDRPDNLFPSIHCLASWLIWVSVRRNKQFSPWLRWGAFVAAVVICISTLTTRQHVIVDVFSGIALAEIFYALAGWSKLARLYERSITLILRALRKLRKEKV